MIPRPEVPALVTQTTVHLMRPGHRVWAGGLQHLATWCGTLADRDAVNHHALAAVTCRRCVARYTAAVDQS